LPELSSWISTRSGPQVRGIYQDLMW